jgi:hypothetical protein
LSTHDNNEEINDLLWVSLDIQDERVYDGRRRRDDDDNLRKANFFELM